MRTSKPQPFRTVAGGGTRPRPLSMRVISAALVRVASAVMLFALAGPPIGFVVASVLSAGTALIDHPGDPLLSFGALLSVYLPIMGIFLCRAGAVAGAITGMAFALMTLAQLSSRKTTLATGGVGAVSGAVSLALLMPPSLNAQPLLPLLASGALCGGIAGAACAALFQRALARQARRAGTATH